MYRLIASMFPLGFPYKDFLKKVEKIFFDSSVQTNIKSKITSGDVYNFLTEINNYPGETYFIGYSNDTKWISLNLIEGSDEVFIHTTLDNPNGKLKDVSKKYSKQGFMINRGKAKLYKVGNISDLEQTLINNANNIINQLI